MINRKKAGILTFHCVNNAGAVLQCYALQETIKKLGVDVEVINYLPKSLTNPYKVVFNPFAHLGNGSFLEKLIVLTRHIRLILLRLKSKIRYGQFRGRYLNLSEKSYKNSGQIALADKYSHYITGSDQVWNSRLLGGFDPVYFLKFPPARSKKIAYAASFGEELENKYYADFQESIRGFDHISVREESAQGFISRFTDKAIECALDPTLLLPREEWEKLAKGAKFKDYILVHDMLSDRRLVDIADALSEEFNLKVISYTKAGNFKKGIHSFAYDGPSAFLGLIKNADFVITSSLHGLTFSILYKKNFIAIPCPPRESRIIDLLNKCKLQERIIRSKEELGQIDLRSPVDFTKTEEILGLEKIKSIEFLKTALG
ncbi:MAG: polysaccharide pyruvyl transferase family protein [Candidatus Omnitrophica bacterium]|nr:polysaccharide pyruvyl transferase family protein [Candidatus Omnitrophota bacterium]